jgi:hypothetical protein
MERQALGIFRAIIARLIHSERLDGQQENRNAPPL